MDDLYKLGLNDTEIRLLKEYNYSYNGYEQFKALLVKVYNNGFEKSVDESIDFVKEAFKHTK